MDFLAEYASFLAKTVTLVVAILVVLIKLRGIARQRSSQIRRPIAGQQAQ